MVQKHCPNCGGSITVHADDAIITCSFCGTSFSPEGTQMKQHFALKVNYSESETFDTLKAYLVKVPGVPNDLAAQISLKNMKMAYYPYWIYNIHGTVSYRGRDRKAHFSNRHGARFRNIHWEWVYETGQEEQTRQIRLYAGPPVRTEIRNYPIATRTRQFFNLAEAKEHTANVLFSRLSEAGARNSAIATARNMVYNRIKRETADLDDVKENFNVTDHAYVHVPIYHIQFTVGGRKIYDAAIDASNGRVLYTEIPRTTGFKLKSIISTVIWLALAGAGAIIALFFSQFFYAGIGLAVIGIIIGILTLYFSFKGVTAEAAR